MSVVIYSDIHVHPHKAGSRQLESGISSRLQDCIDVLDQVYTYAHENGITKVLFAGDLFHTRRAVDTSAFNAVYARMAHWADQGILTIAIPGNHDCYDRRGGGIHSLEPLCDIIQVIDSPQWVRLSKDTYAICMPYVHERAAFVEALNTAIDARPKRANRAVGMFHQAIHGGVLNAGKIAHHHDGPIQVSDLRPDVLDRVFLGDFHIPQCLLEDQVYYVGATLQHGWRDVGNPCGFVVLDLDDLSMERVPTNYPEFVQLGVGDLDSAPDDSFVRVTCSPTQEEYVRSVLGDRVRSIECIPIEDAAKMPQRRDVVTLAMKREEVLKRYVDRMSGRWSGDIQTLLDHGIQLLSDA
jgi:DNA repair exonuclease SbcCD nuclease subunit